MKKLLVIEHVAVEGPGTIREFAAESGWDLVEIDLGAGERLPKDPSAYDGVICMGGPMNVYEEERYLFLKDEDRFLKALVREGVPYIGICLGAQLLAKAMGGAITKSPTREIGWSEITLTEDGTADPLFSGMGRVLPVFQWHEDTFSVPAGAVLLAEGTACRNQTFGSQGKAYGLQFHVETDEWMIRKWLDGTDDPSIDRDRIMSVAAERAATLKRYAFTLYRNFDRLL
jgi:GMP synthase-like glutamine amidotransferase